MQYRISGRELTAVFDGFSLLSVAPEGEKSFLSLRCTEEMCRAVEVLHEGGLMYRIYGYRQETIGFGKEEASVSALAYQIPGRAALTVLFHAGDRGISLRLLPESGTQMRLIRHFPLGTASRDVFLLSRGKRTLLLLAEGDASCGDDGEIVFPNGRGQIGLSFGPIPKAAPLLSAMRAAEDVFYLLRRKPQNRFYLAVRKEIASFAATAEEALPETFAKTQSGKILIREVTKLLGASAGLHGKETVDVYETASVFFFLLSLGRREEAKKFLFDYAALAEKHGFYPRLPRYTLLSAEEKAEMCECGAALVFLSMWCGLGTTKCARYQPLIEEAYRTVLASLSDRMLPPAFPEKAVGEACEWGDAGQTAFFLSLLSGLSSLLPGKEKEFSALGEEISNAFPERFIPDGTFRPLCPDRAKVGGRKHAVYAKCPCCGEIGTLLLRKNFGYRCVGCLEEKEEKVFAAGFDAVSFLTVLHVQPALLPERIAADGLGQIGHGGALSDTAFGLFLLTDRGNDRIHMKVGLRRLEETETPLPERFALCTALIEAAKRSGTIPLT